MSVNQAGQAPQVEAAMDKVRHSLSRLTLDYRQWIQAQQSLDVTVALLYTSAYSNTAALGEAIAPPTSDFRLPTSDFTRPKSSHFRLPTSHVQKALSFLDLLVLLVLVWRYDCPYGTNEIPSEYYVN